MKHSQKLGSTLAGDENVVKHIDEDKNPGEAHAQLVVKIYFASHFHALHMKYMLD